MTYQSTNDEWYTEPCAVLDESKDMSAGEKSEDHTGDGTTDERWCVRPKDVFLFRCTRHGGPKWSSGVAVRGEKLFRGFLVQISLVNHCNCIKQRRGEGDELWCESQKS